MVDLNLDHIPILLTNKRPAWVSILSALACLAPAAFFDFAIFSELSKAPASARVVWALSALIPAGLGLFGTLKIARKPLRTMRIDLQGVHLSDRGYVIDYLWRDLEKAELVEVRQGSSYVARIRIVRKGQIILALAGGEELISLEFGVGLHQIVSLINDGIARWGAPLQTTR